MTKKSLNQNAKYVQELINIIEPNFVFGNKPINRLKEIKYEKSVEQDKSKRLIELKSRINSIENCNLKQNSKNMVLSSGSINSSIMLVGETPGELEDKSGLPFQGDIGTLLNKMLIAINLNPKKVYLTYSINYRTPEDRKPSSQEIKRYSPFLKKHISIIDPKIIVLLGTTAMESVTGSKDKISNERGKWKEVILGSKSIPLMVTLSPSYLLRFPENKKYSWEDLKKIRKKIQDLNIKI